MRHGAKPTADNDPHRVCNASIANIANYAHHVEAQMHWQAQQKERLAREGYAERAQTVQLRANHATLLTFAHLVSAFCHDDSAGHMRYLKGQADFAIGRCGAAN